MGLRMGLGRVYFEIQSSDAVLGYQMHDRVSYTEEAVILETFMTSLQMLANSILSAFLYPFGKADQPLEDYIAQL